MFNKKIYSGYNTLKYLQYTWIIYKNNIIILYIIKHT